MLLFEPQMSPDGSSCHILAEFSRVSWRVLPAVNLLKWQYLAAFSVAEKLSKT